MKKIILTSLSALMLSVATAGAAETESKVFFAINGGVYGVNYDTIVDTLFSTGMVSDMIHRTLGNPHGLGKPITAEFPKHDTILGMEAGMRYGKHSSVWNGGFTIGAEKTLGKRPTMKRIGGWRDNYDLDIMLKDMKVNTNILSATFDNYIRLNKSKEHRADFVIGVGVADVETNMKIFDMGTSMSAHAAVLKAGMEVELTDVISMTLGSRMFVPVSGQYFDSSYAIKGGFKFSF